MLQSNLQRLQIKKRKATLVPVHSLKAYMGEAEVFLYSFLTTALEGGKGSAYRVGRFTPRERNPVLISYGC